MQHGSDCVHTCPTYTTCISIRRCCKFSWRSTVQRFPILKDWANVGDYTLLRSLLYEDDRFFMYFRISKVEVAEIIFYWLFVPHV